MDPEGEIRLQAFMIGNGNISLPSLAILIFGSILLPSQWRQLYWDFKKGLNSIPVSSWTIEEFGHHELSSLRMELDKSTAPSNSIFDLKKLTRVGALTAIISGLAEWFSASLTCSLPIFRT